ncbi:HupE/UreJ family protein [Chelatococcus sp. SYSU_G07232]|uniref:HupE/UreJ family protein n=1 Tax=Chelatococcus albus TaxID=3047466 RepID=A0ABT7AHX7_9HYPH|nr:HupE/UreJ family protein [Chelatococcus sp. SYSU_G07232]MDJ1158974.1 HupE/UreJ family protein [Chelatococcus sp. SYSU_G07232]
MTSVRSIAAAVLALAATPALAHTGASGVASALDGFTHPFGGLDHVLAMVTVGLWAGTVGGRAVFAYPVAFLAFMAAGGALGAGGVALPAVEAGIGLSVLVLGAAVAARPVASSDSTEHVSIHSGRAHVRWRGPSVLGRTGLHFGGESSGLPLALGTALCAVFALFHGHAHGAEMAAGAGAAAYGAGFIAATALLHGAGLALALVFARGAGTATLVALPRLAGTAVAVAGALMLVS